MSEQIGIGSTVWLFDQNRRKYADPLPGETHGRLIYARCWYPMKIVGENRASWLLERDGAFPKRKSPEVPYLSTYAKGGWSGLRVALSQQEVDDDIWRNNNAHRIREMVSLTRDIAILRQIAALIGYKETE